MFTVASLCALLIGLTLGIFGAGGSILTVPVLHYLVGLDALAATSTSLIIVGVTALAAAILYAKQGKVHLPSGLAFAIPSIAGMALVRTLVMPQLPQQISLFDLAIDRDLLIIIPFSVVMLAAALAMVRNSSKRLTQQPEPNTMPDTRSRPQMIPAILSGFIVGGISGFVGAGGGFMVIPALHLLLQLPMSSAVGTSLMVIAINSSSGAISDYLAGSPANYSLAALMSLLSLAGMLAGVKFSKRIDGAKLKRSFGYFLVAMAVVILLKEVSSL